MVMLVNTIAAVETGGIVGKVSTPTALLLTADGFIWRQETAELWAVSGGRFIITSAIGSQFDKP
jgi:hypothetical protein